VGSHPESATTVPRLWNEAARRHRDRTALVDAYGRITYRELAARKDTAARRLRVLVPNAGGLVLVVLPGGRAFCTVFLGALTAGLVVPAAEDTTDYQFRWLVADAEPDLVVTTEDRAPGLRAATSAAVVTVADILGRSSIVAAAEVDDGGVSPDDVALVLYTSGSSGRPKGIVCPHRTVVWVARAIGSVLRYRADDVVFVRLPVSFDYGLYQILLCALAGASITFPAGRLGAGELRDIRSSGATVLPLVPSLAATLTRLARRDPAPTSLRLFTNTGEALVGSTMAELRAAFPGVSLVCMYGMSECKRITIAEPDEDTVHQGTVGRALPGTELFILDEDRQPVPAGVVGQIMSAGPHVMAGYFNAPESTAEHFVSAPDGRAPALLTGDYGCLDADGRLYFRGRRDALFKRRGLRMSSLEIEAALADIPGVDAVACRPPAVDGVLTVWVVTALDELSLREAALERLGVSRMPDRFVFVAALPVNSNGKIERSALPDPSDGGA
jgi:acyl-CoA synthetase (AMP-forming)/AMP-acid ligase II